MSNGAIQVPYILDTNVLFELAVWIPLKLNLIFWQKLRDSLKKGDWVLLDEVVAEIKSNGDLKKWCKAREAEGLVTVVTPQVKIRGIEINDIYNVIDDITLKSTTDVYIIAYAELNKMKVFTREGERKINETRNKIPDVCRALNIPFVRFPDQFYADMGFRF